MTEQAKYISGRTVQEQMQNLIGYVDGRSETVAGEKAQEVLAPAVEAKNAAEAAAVRAEAAAAETVDCVKKTGGDVPQVISGNGGLQVTGDLSVGDDLTVGGSLHADVSNAEIAGMAIEKSGSATRLSNENGISINGLYLSDMVSKARTDAQQMQGDLRVVNPGETEDSVQTKAQVAAALDSYSQVVRTTGNQNVAGEKSFTSEIKTKFNALDIDTIPSAPQYPSFIRFVDKDGDSLGNIGGIETTAQSYRSFGTRAKMTNGEIKSFSIQLRVDRATNHFVVQISWPDGTYTTLAEKTIA